MAARIATASSTPSPQANTFVPSGTCALQVFESRLPTFPLTLNRCNGIVERLDISGRAEIVICTPQDILIFSINGVLVAQCPCEDKLTGMQVVPSSAGHSYSLSFFCLFHSITWCCPGKGGFLVTAGNYIVFRHMDDLSPIHKLDFNLRDQNAPPSSITAFYLTFPPEETKRR